MSDKKVIAYDSPKAARWGRVTGWIASNGRFWANDEHMARYDGSTHQQCRGGCGTLVENHGSMHCKACAEVNRAEKYAAMQKEIWDGETFLYSDSKDIYFNDRECLLNYLTEHPDDTIESLDLIICEPNMAEEIDGNEHFCDQLSEDGEISAELEAAFEALNEVIRKEPPLSWSPGNTAAIVELIAAAPTGDDK